MLTKLKKIWNTIVQPKQVMGIDLILSNNGKYTISFSLLKLEKGEIITIDTKTGITNLNIIKEKLLENTPVALAIDGKGVLSKELAVAINTPDKDLIKQIIPGAKIEDFYLQKQELGTGKLWVSIIRKEVLDQILKDFTDQSVDVVKLSLGIVAIETVTPILLRDKKELTITTGTYNIEYSDGAMAKITRSITDKQEDISLGNTPISSTLFLSYTLAMQAFLDKQVGLALPIIEKHKENNVHRRMAKPILLGTVGFFFLLILLNFLYFSYLSSVVNALSGDLQIHKSNLNNLETLSNEVNSKKAFLKETGWLQSSKTSYYADQLALSLPKSSKFIELTVYPEYKDLKNSRDNTLKAFESNKILISGSSQNSKVFNDWLAKVKKWDWVKEANLLSYSQNRIGSKASFSLSILL